MTGRGLATAEWAEERLAHLRLAGRVNPRFPLEAYDPRNHAHDCGYHLDQYPWECSCGLVNREA